MVPTRPRSGLEETPPIVEPITGEADSFMALLGEARVGVARIDPNGLILQVNEHYCEMTGLPRDELLGGPARLLVPSSDHDRFQRTFKRLLLGGPNLRMESRFSRSDGTRVWASQQFLARHGDEGKAVEVLAVCQDDTARRNTKNHLSALNQQLEEQMSHRTTELEATIREMESFNYSITHDLRTPLRAIRGFTGLILENPKTADELPPGTRAQLENAYEATKRMSDTIDGLLRLSRMSRIELRRQSVDLSSFVQTYMAQLKKRNPERSLKLSVEKGLLAQAEPQMVEVLLQNLLENAWKFTRHREKAEIQFGTTTHEGRLHYFVRDNGAGFNMADADKLFQPFRRLHKASEYEGSGIGLATVYRIVRRHGGKISASAAPEEGATFYFTLSRWEQWG